MRARTLSRPWVLEILSGRKKLLRGWLRLGDLRLDGTPAAALVSARLGRQGRHVYLNTVPRDPRKPRRVEVAAGFGSHTRTRRLFAAIAFCPES